MTEAIRKEIIKQQVHNFLSPDFRVQWIDRDRKMAIIFREQEKDFFYVTHFVYRYLKHLS